ncbi:MAG: hypothetical protein V4850_22230 [Myxococcota bacterium]
MTPIGFHVTMRLSDDRVIAPSAAARRRIARLVRYHGAACGLLAFRVVDSHLHVLLLCDRAAAGEFARRLAIAIQAVITPGAPFEPCRCRPFTDAAHLRNAFDYVLRQNARHGVAHDPRHDGSVLPDLLGLRIGGRDIALRVREYLPRVTREDLLVHLGLATLEEGVGAPGDALVEAATAAFALPDLAGSSHDVLHARAAAIAVLPDAPTTQLVEALGVSPRSIQRARLLKPPPAHVRAVRLQLSLADALDADRAPPPAAPLRGAPARGPTGPDARHLGG